MGTDYIYDGYMAEINFIDGQALAPTDFGETNNDGVWVPKAYEGTYGTNGFYITGENSADLGEDFSGNNNDFTSSGLTSDDQVTDTPTNNFCTLNPLDMQPANVLSNGNLSTTASVGGYTSGGRASMAFPNGVDIHFEAETTISGASTYIGILKNSVKIVQDTSNVIYNSSDFYGYRANGKKVNGGTETAYGATFTSGDIIGVALSSAGVLTFYKNGVSQGSAFTGLDPTEFSPAWIAYANSSWDFNFGATDFTYTPPTGFSALSTANLPTPAIADGSKYFQTTLYTATGSALEVNQVGNSTFQPDFVWIKNRTQASGQMINDAVTGAQKFLRADLTAGQTTQTQGLVSFDSDGFSVGTNGDFNYGTDSFVGWQWLAGNGTASNTDGSITSTVSANTTDGFSVLTFAGSGGTGTVGHGLSQSPNFIIVKSRDTSNAWYTGSDFYTTWEYYQTLNSTAAQAAGSTVWNSTAPTSSVFSIGASLNTSAEDYVAYCWHSVEGFSKIGKYTGNGSLDGPFVWCGFRPSFLMVKRTDVASDWFMLDNQRPGYNVIGGGGVGQLPANLTYAESSLSTYAIVDFLSNGFKVRHDMTYGYWNASGGTYIFMAFAEHPFGGDGVAPAPAR